MTNILDLLAGSLDGNTISKLDQQVGIGDENKTAAALEGISKVILAGVNRNAQTSEGLQSLNNALEKDHRGDIFNDVLGNLLNQDARRSQGQGYDRTLNGAGILRHVLGGKESSVFDSLSKSTNVDKGKLLSLAIKFAPFILGALGKAKRENGLDSKGLGSLLGSVMNSVTSNSSSQSNILNSILDQDGDGNIVDDVAGIGKKIFGGLFK